MSVSDSISVIIALMVIVGGLSGGSNGAGSLDKLHTNLKVEFPKSRCDSVAEFKQINLPTFSVMTSEAVAHLRPLYKSLCHLRVMGDVVAENRGISLGFVLWLVTASE